MKKFIFIFLCIILLSSCKSLSSYCCPYNLYGEHLISGESGFSNCYVMEVENRISKSVIAMDFILCLFDMDGEPVFEEDWIKFHFDFSDFPIEENCHERRIINLDEYISSVPEEPYLTDYFYASKIVYSDGSVMEDPFGRYAR